MVVNILDIFCKKYSNISIGPSTMQRGDENCNLVVTLSFLLDLNDLSFSNYGPS